MRGIGWVVILLGCLCIIAQKINIWALHVIMKTYGGIILNFSQQNWICEAKSESIARKTWHIKHTSNHLLFLSIVTCFSQFLSIICDCVVLYTYLPHNHQIFRSYVWSWRVSFQLNWVVSGSESMAMAAMGRASSGLQYPERFYAAASYVGFDGSTSPTKALTSKFPKSTALLLYSLYHQAHSSFHCLLSSLYQFPISLLV